MPEVRTERLNAQVSVLGQCKIQRVQKPHPTSYNDWRLHDYMITSVLRVLTDCLSLFLRTEREVL